MRHRSVCTGFLFLSVAVAASAQVVRVDENNPDWGFFEEIPSGTGAFTFGPGALAPLGEGAAGFAVDDSGRQILGTLTYAGTRLDQFTELSYRTYRIEPESGVVQLSLQLNVDYDVTDGDTSTWQGRLVFEPYLDGSAVMNGVWQSWNALAGGWWSSGFPGNTACPQSDPCSWSEVLTAFPDAGLWSDARGVLLLKAGGPWSGGFFGLADALVVGVGGPIVFYDFETAFGIFADGFESGDLGRWSLDGSGVP